jgi:hypothetical protein
MGLTYYPLLDVKRALEDADAALQDVIFYVEILGRGERPDLPPDTATFLGNIKAVRALLSMAIPPRVVAAMAQEQANFAACERYLGQL